MMGRRGYIWFFSMLVLRIAWVLTVKDYWIYRNMAIRESNRFGKAMYVAMAQDTVNDYIKLCIDLQALV